MILADHINGFKKLRQTLSRLCRYKQNFRVRHIRKRISHLLGKTVNSLIVLLHRIPLVHGDNDSLPPVMSDSRDFGILFRDALHRIDDQHHYLRPLHCADRADDHEPFQFLFYLILAAESRRIDKHIFLPIVGNLRIHRISGGSRNVRHNQTVLPQQFIDQGRFPYIGLAHDGYSGTVILFLFGISILEIRSHLIQHISQTHFIRCRNGIGLPDSQIVKLIDIRHIFVKAVHLIDHQHHRLAGAAQHIGHLGIRIHQSLLHVHQENDNIRRLYGNLRLSAHLG